MKKAALGALLAIMVVICIVLFSTGNFVTNVYAGDCQYCAWNSSQQTYECKWYHGYGWYLCHPGTDCYGLDPCAPGG